MDTNNFTSWDIEDNTNIIKKRIKIVEPTNSIKIGLVSQVQKNYEEISEENINKILNTDLINEEDLVILTNIKIVLDSLIKYIMDNKKDEFINIDINIINKKIEWFKKYNILMAEKRKLPEITHSLEHYLKKNFCIVRNSYNFCENKSACPYYYGKYVSYNSKFKKGDGNCNKQHFVYNYVVCDIIEIEKYISTTSDINFMELDKSFKTIKFVIDHMRSELENKDNKQDSIIAKKNYAISGLSNKNIVLDD